MKQFELPVYVTKRSSEEITGYDVDILGVALDVEVAITRLTIFMFAKRQSLTFTAMDETDLAVWAKKNDSPCAEDAWQVSANKRLWISCCDSIVIEEHDAMDPLEGEL